MREHATGGAGMAARELGAEDFEALEAIGRRSQGRAITRSEIDRILRAHGRPKTRGPVDCAEIMRVAGACARIADARRKERLDAAMLELGIERR